MGVSGAGRNRSGVERAGIVLCGGRSLRMGRAKAWLPWFGRPLVEHVARILLPVVDEVIVVGSESLELPPLPARVVFDSKPGLGPLVGIREGLAATEAELAFVASTDCPFLSGAFVEEMFAHGCAAAPVAEGHVQALCAVYPGAAVAKADALIANGIARPLALLEAERFMPIEFEEGEGPHAWHGFNTPEAYLSAARGLDPLATAEVELLGRGTLGAERRRLQVPIGTLGEVLAAMPESLGLIEPCEDEAAGRSAEGVRLAKAHLVCLGGRELVRDLSLPVGPGERLSVLDSESSDTGQTERRRV